MYRVLNAEDQCHRRGRAQAPGKHKAPTSYRAEAANQVWSWDITYLPTPVRGQFYYLYLFEDIYSRKAVGWEVYEQESGELAAGLLHRNDRAVFYKSTGAAFRQWCADEIAHTVNKNV